ncbi:MAG TPA: glycosyltransferase family 4 protein [Microlunatus sp.]
MLPDTTPLVDHPEPRIGYLMKMYPRFSETFILTELLALEAQGWDLEIFSLRTPNDGRFHPDLARVKAPVRYLQPGGVTAAHLMQALADYLADFGQIDQDQLSRLVQLPAREAAQALDLARAVRADGITHLHAHFGSVATTVARQAAVLSGIGYSFTAHAKDIFHQEVDTAELGTKIADARAVITVSDYNLRYLADRFPEVAGSIRRVYNGIDLDRFRYRSQADRTERPMIAAVGRLVEKKGFDDLISAARVLVDRGQDFRLGIAGAGPLDDQLQTQITELGLDGQVSLIGPLPQDQVREFVASATVFAAPCRVGGDGNRDGLPTVLLEAMAVGTPCISTPVTGIPEAIEHRRTGLLVPEGDVAALADALGELLGDAGMRAGLAAAAREQIEQEFDAVRQAAKVGDLLAAVHRPVELIR